MPKNIQPSKVVSKLCYVTTFHSDLAFILMERRYVTLHHMFFDAHEVEDKLVDCGMLSDRIENDEWNFVEHYTVEEQEKVDLHLDPCQYE